MSLSFSVKLNIFWVLVELFEKLFRFKLAFNDIVADLDKILLVLLFWLRLFIFILLSVFKFDISLFSSSNLLNLSL